MEKFIINGGKPLKGEVNICGAKNAAIAILPAILLVKGTCRIENLPNISDVKKYIEVLQELGVKITYESPNEIFVENTEVNSTKCLFEKCRKMRASYYLLGSLLGRYKSVEVPFPGGCDFGTRPIDQHIKGFTALNAQVTLEDGIIKANAKKLVGTSIYLDVVSVGATINILLASVLAEGTTFIENAAKEPHIVDLANFLNAMGANIKGAGTDTIKIQGVKELPGNTAYSIIPDQIEAGTFMIAAAATGGDVIVKNCIPKHLDSLTSKLIEMGITVEEMGDSIHVKCDKRPQKATIKTLPYPGFPTDMQPQMAVLLSIANGTSILTEGVWENRFQYVSELQKLGANIRIEGRSAIIEGVKNLTGSFVNSPDLRGGAALIIAGLAAKNVTEVYNLDHVDRGYENFEQKLKNLGAKIERVKVE
ncbi:MAG: UDP-N-acetylglucosamine 1-carboxyvinyltransferase [Clostridia bacterium]|nr:UDP-N-acetylglucosamine 1-carboxyvinyltransferase [Clostridia bacterium]